MPNLRDLAYLALTIINFLSDDLILQKQYNLNNIYIMFDSSLSKNQNILSIFN